MEKPFWRPAKAAYLAAIVEHLGLRSAVHIGHSTGGGEVWHATARDGSPRL